MTLSSERSSSILFVCSANVSRSPTAEALLRHHLGAGGLGNLQLRSAGTTAIRGQPIDERMAKLLSDRGIDASGHRSVQVTRADITSSSLVLAMAAEHRSKLAVMEPSTRPRTFTLLEFARLTEALKSRGTGGETLDDLVKEVARLRAYAPMPPGATDINDPFRRSWWTYRRTMRQLVAAVATLADALELVSVRS